MSVTRIGTRSDARLGFTLLETVVVFAIMGALFAVAVPAMGTAFVSRATETPQERLVELFENTRVRGIHAGKAMLVLPHWTGFTVYSEARPGEPQTRDLIPADWEVIDPKPIRFSSRGTVDGGPIQFRTPQGIMMIRFDRWTGEATVVHDSDGRPR